MRAFDAPIGWPADILTLQHRSDLQANRMPLSSLKRVLAGDSSATSPSETEAMLAAVPLRSVIYPMATQSGC